MPERQSGVAVPVPQLDDWTTLPTIIRLQDTLGQTEFDCRGDSYSQSHQNDSNSSIECSTSLTWSFDSEFSPHLAFLEISGMSDSSAPRGASHCQLHAAAHYGESSLSLQSSDPPSLRSDHRMRVETRCSIFGNRNPPRGKTATPAPRYTCLAQSGEFCCCITLR